MQHLRALVLNTKPDAGQVDGDCPIPDRLIALRLVLRDHFRHLVTARNIGAHENGALTSGLD